MSKRWFVLLPLLSLSLVVAGCDDDDDDGLCEDVSCGDHGTCNPDDGLCECDAGWSGEACDVEVLDCGDHGTFDDAVGICACDTGYVGDLCDECDDGFVSEGEECVAVECTDDSDCDDGMACNGAETCDESGSCVDGEAIECSDNATCTEPDGVCECDEGYQLVGEPGECLREVLADFEDLTLDAESFWNGSDESGSFTTGSVTFYNSYNTEYFSWDGFAYSSMTDTTTAGFENQYSAIPGAGAGDSSTYGVAYVSAFSAIGLPTLELAEASMLSGIYVTNTTYAYLSMLEGDGVAKQFGGETGEDSDWFMLTIEGFDGEGTSTGTVEFYLADFRAESSDEDYIIDEWTFVDLTSLGEVASLQFSLDSTDVGEYGMNMPAYFAIDDVMLYGN